MDDISLTDIKHSYLLEIFRNITYMFELNVGLGGSAGVDRVSPIEGPETKPPLPP